MDQVSTLLANDEKLKDLTNAANTFNNLFTTIIEKLNSKQTEQTEGEIKSIMHSLKQNKIIRLQRKNKCNLKNLCTSQSSIKLHL